MNYFIDTEFIEGTQKTPFGKTKPTIDLISIGIVSGNAKTYYAISKDFNLKEAWNRYDLVDDNSVGVRIGALPPKKKVYWIRENVLMPIFFDLAWNDFHSTHYKDDWHVNGVDVTLETFKADPIWSGNFKWFKRLINEYGKTNKQIADEVKEFVYKCAMTNMHEQMDLPKENAGKWVPGVVESIRFYAYYASYDWVAFCWLFGKMIDLPKGFPKYCMDIKQMVDEKVEMIAKLHGTNYSLSDLKSIATYPKDVNAHNALADAIWNRQLYEFLKTI